MRQLFCFSRFARDKKINARGGVKMRHFRAKSQHLNTLVDTVSYSLCRHLCQPVVVVQAVLPGGGGQQLLVPPGLPLDPN